MVIWAPHWHEIAWKRAGVLWALYWDERGWKRIGTACILGRPLSHSCIFLAQGHIARIPGPVGVGEGGVYS